MNEQPEAIRQLLAQTATQTAFSLEAVALVFSAHQAAEQRLVSIPLDHAPAFVPPEIVCCWVCRMAWEEFGENARQQLSSWKIEGPENVAHIVRELYLSQLIKRPVDECPKDYRHLASFSEVLAAIADAPPIGEPLRPYQFRLSSLLILTTVLAVIFAGFGRLQVQGALIAIYIGWMACIAGVCFWSALAHRGPGRVAGFVVGALMAACAALGFIGLFVYSQKPPP